MAQSTTTLPSNEEVAPISTVSPVEGEQSFPFKTFMSSKTFYPREHSLSAVLSPRRSSLKDFHARFANDLKQRRSISFPSTLKEEPVEVDEPPAKRRRFERRNSKTAAMLFSSMSSIVASDLGDEDTKEERSSLAEETDDPWAGGLEIAEELVRQLKLRRINQASTST